MDTVSSSFVFEKNNGLSTIRYQGPFCRLSNANSLAIQLDTQNQTDIANVGKQLWSGSLLLAEYFLNMYGSNLFILGKQIRLVTRRNMDLSQTTILEVGCGTGLLSILLSSLCKKCIATDYTQELIDLAKVLILFLFYV